VAFVPPSSLFSGAVTVAGVVTVDVDNFPAVQAISATSLPLPDGAATEETLSDVGLTAILQRDRMVTE
jgi:hypothetical protein